MKRCVSLENRDARRVEFRWPFTQTFFALPGDLDLADQGLHFVSFSTRIPAYLVNNGIAASILPSHS